MAIRRLDEGTQSHLRDMPETGMGYHFIRARDPRAQWGPERDFLVLGSTFALDLEDDLIELLNKNNQATLDALATGATESGLTIATSFSTPQKARAALASKLAAVVGAPAVPPPGSTLTLKTTSSGDDGFLRFFYTRSDPRVSPAGAVAKGTYATTYRDGVIVTSGFSAVARYALPVPLAAEFVHVLTPPAGVSVEIGAAVPLFGQAGGGVEVFFPNAFPSAFRPISMPPY
jgi:hypothetical protein